MNIKQQFSDLLWSTDVRMVEFLFGIQAVMTSILSLIVDENMVLTSLFLWINGIAGLPQIWAAIRNNFLWRHWTNIATFISSMGISVSLVGQSSNEIAIFGYFALGLATLFCAIRTHLILHINH